MAYLTGVCVLYDIMELHPHVFDGGSVDDQKHGNDRGVHLALSNGLIRSAAFSCDLWDIAGLEEQS